LYSAACGHHHHHHAWYITYWQPGIMYNFNYQYFTPSLWRWNWQRVPKRQQITIWRRGNTQKNKYIIYQYINNLLHTFFLYFSWWHNTHSTSTLLTHINLAQIILSVFYTLI
jgi:hypothetical protein